MLQGAAVGRGPEAGVLQGGGVCAGRVAGDVGAGHEGMDKVSLESPVQCTRHEGAIGGTRNERGDYAGVRGAGVRALGNGG